MCIALVCTSKEVVKDSKSESICTKGGLTFYIMFLTIDVLLSSNSLF